MTVFINTCLFPTAQKLPQIKQQLVENTVGGRAVAALSRTPRVLTAL